MQRQLKRTAQNNFNVMLPDIRGGNTTRDGHHQLQTLTTGQTAVTSASPIPFLSETIVSVDNNIDQRSCHQHFIIISRLIFAVFR